MEPISPAHQSRVREMTCAPSNHQDEMAAQLKCGVLAGSGQFMSPHHWPPGRPALRTASPKAAAAPRLLLRTDMNLMSQLLHTHLPSPLVPTRLL